MVSRVHTPLLAEAEQRLGRMPRGGISLVARLTGLPIGRVRQMAKGTQPTGSKRLGPPNQQVQLVVYALRKLQEQPVQEHTNHA